MKYVYFVCAIVFAVLGAIMLITGGDRVTVGLCGAGAVCWLNSYDVEVMKERIRRMEYRRYE